MLLSIFRLNYAFINLLFGLLLAGLWSIPFFRKFDPKFSSQSVLGIGFEQIDYNISVGLGFLATLSIAALANALFNKSNLSTKSTSLPGLLCAVFLLYDPQHFFFCGEHVFYICLLAGLIFMSNINRNYPSMETTFLFGILVGIGSLFLNAGAFALLIPWIFLTILRPFVWREYIAAFLGFVLVACIVASIQLFKHTGGLNIFPDSSPSHLMPYQSEHVEITFVIAFFFGVMLLNGLRAYLKKMSTSVLRWKKMSRILLSSFLVLVASCVVNDLQLYGNDIYFPIAIICAFIGTFYLQESKREWLQVLLFHGYLALVIVNLFL